MFAPFDETESLSPPSPKRIRVNVEPDSNTQANLAANLWHKRPEFTDVVFVVGGDEFPAHKMVLASRSQYFKSMLYGRMREASQKKIKLFSDDSVTPATFKKMLQYAYTESLKIYETLDDILDIMYAADYLGYDTLKSKLGTHLASNIDADSVLKLYVFSKENNLLNPYNVDKECLEFIEDHSNTGTILKSSGSLELPREYLIALISRDTFVAPENDILQAVVKWRAHNDVEDMVDVAQHIRLSRFTALEIFTIVEPTGLFTETDILDGIRVLDTTNLSMTCPRGRCWPQTNLLEEVRNITFDSGRERSSETIELPKSYLVNFLCFEIHPDLPASDRAKWYSYEVTVFLDGQNQLKLFHYSKDEFHCRGQQVLFFPTIPLRRVEVQIRTMEGIEDTRHQHQHQYQKRHYGSSVRENSSTTHTTITSHRISALQFSDKNIPFKYIKGVIAPLCDYKVQFTTFPKNEHNKLSTEAFFNQPYSASSLTIELTYDPEVSVANIEFIISQKQNRMEIKKDLRMQNISSPIEITFEVMVIGYVKVTITPVPGLSKLAPDKHVTINSIRCKSSATRDDVDMDQWGPYIRAS